MRSWVQERIVSSVLKSPLSVSGWAFSTPTQPPGAYLSQGLGRVVLGLDAHRHVPDDGAEDAVGGGAREAQHLVDEHCFH